MSTYPTQRLVLHNDLAELKRLEGWIGGLAHRVSPEMLFTIQLCLEEAIANIIMYARAKDNLLHIAVEIECTDDETLIARVEDSGQPFDPTQVPAPTLAKSLAEAKVGNLGIHLIRNFASEMHYEHQDDRNRLTLRFKRRLSSQTLHGLPGNATQHRPKMGDGRR